MTFSTHVLDSATGAPAAGVPVILSRLGDGVWHELAAGVTDADGRWRAPDSVPLTAGADHRIVFDLRACGRTPFYPEVAVAFRPVEGRRHHHVPLLLSPFSYSTYLGS